MGFFDDLGKKMSDAGQTAVQKTKEMSDIARINSSINQNEFKINNLYSQIGKCYVEKYGVDGDPELAELVKSIKDAENQNAEYRNQIQDIKGVIRCPSCGAEIPKDAAFCSSCGASIPKVETTIGDDLVRCEKCGTFVKKGMRFCTSCGQPMVIHEQQIDESASEPEECVVEPTEKKCPNCGATMDLDSDFCSECGTRL